MLLSSRVNTTETDDLQKWGMGTFLNNVARQLRHPMQRAKLREACDKLTEVKDAKDFGGNMYE